MILRRLALRFLPRPALIPERSAGPYALVSAEPPIVYVKHWLDEELRVQYRLDALFELLRGRRAWFLYSWRWWIEEPARIEVVRRLEARHRRRHPGHRFVHLCNTEAQTDRFREAGLDAVFCNQNALCDERVFRPLPGVEKRFDAVYDARLKDYKRHELARELRSLALLHERDPASDSAYVASLRSLLAHAHWFNEEGGEYRLLDFSDVNRCLNACRVGLCLSAREGAMYASMQYLLAGLPVVSTRSEGGRDVFFDPAHTRIVDDHPHAVREGVAEMLRRNAAPEAVREAALAKLRVHRTRFARVVQRIYDTEGAGRSFEAEWEGLFFHRLFRERQPHAETLARLRAERR